MPERAVPSAREAARRADEVRAGQNATHRARCLRLLEQAIERGHREADLPHPLPADLEQELWTKGYSTGQPFQSGYNEYSVPVRW